ncbi:Uncharacterised protein [Mycobacteroides abscessus]|uniref:hypothetical protein n=1 Tax=Mycobacteroides abscessus TaxID=36809 RepID=UPI0005E3630A|nr:hypothetical protein [Mycobacteroides abscessus]CPR39615.1 Uncharacterised protein [Mycobacteroides abscessus]CPR91360.1 Uncharacterised protein [Mycobacteroides abscessus]CPR95696.1 Uncharacterised protein [Mycobacteroides abscessus]CPS19376.1 Uncharacterised protein [Mycobacteroides abscessus]CPS41330.1 Uncharacterised protein [Mycobacteroides abscessus]
MSKNSRRKNTRQHDFTVIARGVHRNTPDFSRLMRATLDHYIASQRDEQPDAERGRSSSGGMQ